MKRVLLLVFIFSFTICFAQQNIDCELDNEFIDYLKNKKALTNNSFNEIPSPYRPNFLKSDHKSFKSFPTKYDLREYNMVTPVKDQAGCGGCWNFVVMGAIESHLLKNNKGIFDLSEQNLRTCHGYEFTNDGSCSAGNHIIASSYLSRRNGPVKESDDVFNTSPDAVCNNNFTPVLFIDEIQFLPNDSSVIKQTIMDYGGVYASMYWNNASYSIVSKNYYYSGNEPVNHAVLIIGWDNNRNTSAGKGAWIAKNSWGTSWGESGYFYISYKDTKILNSAAIFKNNKVEDDSLSSFLYYDKLGMTSSTGFNSETAYALTKFTSEYKSSVNSIGTYINSENTILDIEIYSNKVGDKLYNLLSKKENVEVKYPGYYRIDLDNKVRLNSNEHFYIKVKYLTPEYMFPIPIEKKIDNYAIPEIVSGVNWISSNSEQWTELGSNISGNEKDLCIRAYCSYDSKEDNIFLNNVSLNPNPSDGIINITFSNINTFENFLKIFDISGKMVYEEIVMNNGNNFVKRIDLTGLKSGIYTIEVSVNNTVYKNKFSLVK